ncbi:MAG: hypothetical protein JWM80_1731 [Cyanobacteria bacterium RYN_339]|nr:hypothetical protein [Cyanobacteria bacterium RYN_339]
MLTSPPAIVQARAILPADTQAAGPPSGRFIGPANGVRPPFAHQPVQGFSGLVPLADGRLLATSDNGYGTPETSADALLRVYTLRPDWRRGTLKAEAYVTLSDPGHHVPWTIVREFTPDRQLTGMDFDPESLARAADGTLWLGDEFGPFLLHVDKGGQLLEAPIPVPEPGDPARMLASPQSPLYEEATPMRLLAALRTEVERSGGHRAPICSPDHHLVVDGDPAIGQDDRPAGASKLFDARLLATAGFATVPWTVNDPVRGRQLVAHGVFGLISDRPDVFMGLAPEIQGHRGARDLRPENTLPSFEAALDAGVPVLETDCHLTRDGVLVLSHEGLLEAPFIRRADGTKLQPKPIRDVGFDELQAAYVADGLQPTRAAQRNDRAASPVAVAFAKAHGLADPYVMPSLDQLFDFVEAYASFYSKDPKRVAVARRVAFNLETKGRPYAFRGEPPSDAAALARAIAAHARSHGMAARTTIESFDFAALLATAREQPAIGTVALFGDWTVQAGGDGTNLEPRAGKAAWLAGMQWPYRYNYASAPPTVPQSGGIEGLALAPDGRLIACLEKGLVGDPIHRTWLQAYDPRTHRWTGERWAYPLDARATSIGEIALTDATHGFAIERDGSQGDLHGFKRIFRFTLGPTLTKAPAVDLLRLQRHGRPYAFPYECPEGLAVLDAHHLLVIADNNFPFGHARRPGRPDDSELVRLMVP